MSPLRLLLPLIVLVLLPGLTTATLRPQEPRVVGQPTGDTARAPDAEQTRFVARHYGTLPLQFEANHGQTHENVRFFTRGHRSTLFLTATEAVLVAHPSGQPIPATAAATTSQSSPASPAETILRMQLLRANPTPNVRGLDEHPGRSHYFVGKHPSQWRTHVPTYARVRYTAVYPGVDLVYYGNQGQLEYDFLVAPGADPHAITLQFPEATSLTLDAQGDLLLPLAEGHVRLHAPVVYQEKEGRRQRIAGAYVLQGPQQVGFTLGAYDPTLPLVIDPVVAYATFLGGTDRDVGLGIAVDAEGAAYVTGVTRSLDFPLAASTALPPDGDTDAFIVKLSPDGSHLLYATYLGGSGDENTYGGISYGAIAIDATGAAYVTGNTTSHDFPIREAFQGTYQGGASDAFVAKISPDGTLVYSTYLGGGGFEAGRSIAVDATGAAYVTGQNESADFPTVHPFQPRHGGGFKDAFLSKLDPTGRFLVYSSPLGGSQYDIGFGVAVDVAGQAYVFGETNSPDFPVTRGAFDQACGSDGYCDGSGDFFLTKVDARGESFVYSTFLGGSGSERSGLGQSLAVDSAGSAYMTGLTYSDDFPGTLGQQRQGPFDAILAKLNSAGTAVVYALYLPGTKEGSGHAIAVDGNRNAYVTGSTAGGFPTTVEAYRCYDPSAFVMKLLANGTTGYALCLSGTSIAKDRGLGIAVDRLHHAYVTGFTMSVDFPTVRPVQPDLGGPTDAFVVKIFPSDIEEKYAALGGPSSSLGAPVGTELTNPQASGRRQQYQYGHIYWNPGTGAHAILQGPIWDTWAAQGWEQGALGYPVDKERVNSRDTGRRQRFVGGSIYWSSATGAHVILTGPIWDAWVAQGRERGSLGYPVDKEYTNPDRKGRRQRFQGGHIYWSPATGAHAILAGPIWAAWAAQGWEQGALGYPVDKEYINPDRKGRRQRFQGGHIYWSPATGAHAIVQGPIWEAWAAQGWEQGLLGYPSSNVSIDPSCGTGGQRHKFENGSICWAPTQGVAVYPAGDTSCLYDAAACSPCVNKLLESISWPSLNINHRDTAFRIDTGRSGFKGNVFKEHNQGVVRLTDVITDGSRVGRMVLTDNYRKDGLTYAENHLDNLEQDTIFSNVVLTTQYRMPIRTTYAHPGGAQAHGNLVAIGMESGPEPHPAAVLFVEFPPGQRGRVTNILKLDGSHGEPVAQRQQGASAAAFVKLRGGRFLLAVAGTDHGREGIWFYESSTTIINERTHWRFIDFWQPPCPGGHDNLGQCFSGASGMALLTDCNGDIYFIGMHGTDRRKFAPEYQWIQVYRLQLTATGEIDLSLQYWQRDNTGAWQTDNPAFRWAGGTYVTEDHEIIIYNAERRTNERDNSCVDGDIYFSK